MGHPESSKWLWEWAKRICRSLSLTSWAVFPLGLMMVSWFCLGIQFWVWRRAIIETHLIKTLTLSFSFVQFVLIIKCVCYVMNTNMESQSMTHVQTRSNLEKNHETRPFCLVLWKKTGDTMKDEWKKSSYLKSRIRRVMTGEISPKMSQTVASCESVIWSNVKAFQLRTWIIPVTQSNAEEITTSNSKVFTSKGQ